MIDLNYIGINNPTAQESYYFYFKADNFNRIVFENFSFKTTDGSGSDWGTIIGFRDPRVFSDGQRIRFDVQTPYTDIFNDLEFATVEFTETKLIINGTEYPCTPRNFSQWVHLHLFNSYYYNNQVKEGTIGTVSYYRNNTLMYKFVPCIDDNNLLCFRKESYEGGIFESEEYVYPNSQTYFYSGSVASTIIVDSDIKAVPASGGTINVTISTDTPWSATSTGSWYTMSQTEGTENDTAITITVPSTTAATQSEDTITFTNENGDTDQLTIKQRKYSGSGIRLIDIGESEVETFYIGNDEVELIYMGEEIVYQKGDGSGISMRSKAKVDTKSGSTYDLKITSSEPWTLSVDTAVTWLNFSQLTGDTGQTIVTITATEDNQTGGNRATTITATTANYSATCEVTQIAVILVDYIHKSTLENSTNYYIDTGIFPTTATKMRFVYMGKGMIARGKFLGFSWGGEEDVYKGATDDSDYRYFGAGGHIYWDYNNSRLENGNFNNYSNGVLYDVEIGNNYVKNNLNETMIVNGTAQTNPPTPNIPIMVNVSCIWLKSLQIWEGQTLVFDGQAAVKDNVIGLYDSITESMFTTSACTLTYEPVELFSWEGLDYQQKLLVYREGDTYSNNGMSYAAISGKLNYNLDYEAAIAEATIGGTNYRFYLNTDGVISIYSYYNSNPQQETFVTDVATGTQYTFANTNAFVVCKISGYDFGIGESNTLSNGMTVKILHPYERVLQYECRVYDNDNSTSYLITKENCPVYGFTHNSPIRFFISNFGGRDEKAIAKLHHPSEARNLFRYLYVYTDGRIGFGTPNDITVINVGNGAVIGEYSVTNTSNYVEITGGYVPRITIKDLY